MAEWLQQQQMRPADLLQLTAKEKLQDRLQEKSQDIAPTKLDPDRLSALLSRGAMLSFAVEKWTNQGLWILGRGDAKYPKRLKQVLKHSAPPIIYGVGNIELLSRGGLAIIGSRDVDEAALNYTQRVARTCSKEDMQVISGGARGVDRTAMLGVLEAGGFAVGILADSLTKTAVDNKYLTSIKDGKLTLISSYDPDAGFNTGNAMGRNKYIYALADYALAIACSAGKGGTWVGAVEALSKFQNIPVFVRIDPNVPEGNRQLCDRGAKAFPVEPWNHPLKKLLLAAASKAKTLQTEEKNISQITQKSDTDNLNYVITTPGSHAKPLETGNECISSPSVPDITTQKEASSSPKNIYEAVLPFILDRLKEPKAAKSLAECLNVRQSQVQDWLDIAVEEGKVTKNKRPVTYVVNRSVNQLSVFWYPML